MAEDIERDMIERITNVLTDLNTYRMRDPMNAQIESVMTQLEMIRDYIKEGRHLTVAQQHDLDFNIVANTPLEEDERLSTELQSIRSFAYNSL